MNEYIAPTDSEVVEAAEYITHNGWLFFRVIYQNPRPDTKELYVLQDLSWSYDSKNGVTDTDGKRCQGFENMDYRQAVRFAALRLQEILKAQ